MVYQIIGPQILKAVQNNLDKPIGLSLVSNKLCTFLLFKYVLGFTICLLVLKLLKIKVVKVIFGHPVYSPMDRH